MEGYRWKAYQIAEVKAILLYALAEKNLLKSTVRARGLESDLELQLEIKGLALEERREQREKRERQRGYAERSRKAETVCVRERRKSFRDS